VPEIGFLNKRKSNIPEMLLAHELDKWRSDIAQEEDESPDFVMASSLITYICQQVEVRDFNHLKEICMLHHKQTNFVVDNSENYVPYFVQKNLQAIFDIVEKCPTELPENQNTAPVAEAHDIVDNLLKQKDIT
jgi:ribonuclease D